MACEKWSHNKCSTAAFCRSQLFGAFIQPKEEFYCIYVPEASSYLPSPPTGSNFWCDHKTSEFIILSAYFYYSSDLVTAKYVSARQPSMPRRLDSPRLGKRYGRPLHRPVFWLRANRNYCKEASNVLILLFSPLLNGSRFILLEFQLYPVFGLCFQLALLLRNGRLFRKFEPSQIGFKNEPHLTGT